MAAARRAIHMNDFIKEDDNTDESIEIIKLSPFENYNSLSSVSQPLFYPVSYAIPDTMGGYCG